MSLNMLIETPGGFDYTGAFYKTIRVALGWRLRMTRGPGGPVQPPFPKNPLLRSLAGAAAAVLVSPLLSASVALAATPIPNDPPNGPSLVPNFVGGAATANKVKAPKVPQHPFMARNGLSNVHNDGYQTDTYTWSGPLGRNPSVNSQFFGTIGSCGITIVFDRHRRPLTNCISSTTQQLRLFDPTTLDTLASVDLPPRVIPPGGNPFTSGGGAYFYLDNKDRSVVSAGRTILVIALNGGAAIPSFSLARTYDLTSVIPEDDQLNSAVPDWSGRLWFVSRFQGVVGALDQQSGEVIDRIELGEEIENSFAVDKHGGVYVVTDEALYRFDINKQGRIETTWRDEYENIHVQKPGQLGAGSGTTPTVMGNKYVSITDNADPMNIVVYRRARKVPAGKRVVCEHPVFEKGASATENSLIGTGTSMIVENNFGYAPPPDATSNGRTTTPGIERVDVAKNGKSCKTVWRSDEIAPSVVPKLSLANGLVYTITKPAGTPDAWYVTAIDYESGQTIWSRLLGTGLFYNNHYAGIAISPNGDLYSGVLGGTVRVADR
jgi:hypothetical protein